MKKVKLFFLGIMLLFLAAAKPMPVLPSISVTSPNGGEIWHGQESHYISWTYTSGTMTVTAVDIEYSLDAGSTWKSIAASTSPNSSPYLWTIPNDRGSDTALIRVRLYYIYGSKGAYTEDMSDAYWTLLTKPEVRWWREIQ